MCADFHVHITCSYVLLCDICIINEIDEITFFFEIKYSILTLEIL